MSADNTHFNILKVIFASVAAVAIILLCVPSSNVFTAFSGERRHLDRMERLKAVTLEQVISELNSSLLMTQMMLNQSQHELASSNLAHLDRMERLNSTALNLEQVVSELNSSLLMTRMMLNKSQHELTSCSLSLHPVVASVPFIDAPLDCSWIEAFGSSHPPNWTALLHICGNTKYRGQMHARVLPAFRDRLIELSNGTGMLHDAFVTFVSGPMRYIHLAHWSIAAASQFSSKPILLFLSGEALSVVSDRVPASAFPTLVVFEMPTLVVFEMPAPIRDPWFDKLRAVLLSPVSNGVVIEADTIITPNAERLFPKPQF